MKRYNACKRTLSIAMALALAIVLFVPVGASGATPFQQKVPQGLVATAIGNGVAISWEILPGAKRHLVYEGRIIGNNPVKYKRIKTVKGRKTIIYNRIKGANYSYYIVSQKKVGNKYVSSLKSAARVTTIPTKGQSTLKNFLRTGISPLGTTMYIWGGGWTGHYVGKKKYKHRTGTSKVWRSFATKQKGIYNYKKYLFKRSKGLDCSGYVGFCVYNIRELRDGKNSYVTSSTNEGKLYAAKGFGKYVNSYSVKTRKAGDIMTKNGHVWICLGECKDGSAVVLHSSPPAVTLAGTPSQKGKKESQAVGLAKKYMKQYYPTLLKKYPGSVYRGNDYNTRYGRMRWNAKTLEDPEGYRDMTADKIMADLFGER